MNMPPFPTSPAREDWFYAARAIQQQVPSPFGRSYVGGQILFLERPDMRPREVQMDDPLGRLVAVARDRMRTRHANSPAYRAFLAEQERQRRAADDAAEQAALRRRQAMTEKERAEEEAFFAAGGTATEWAIEQEARAEAKADATKKRATARTRSKARSTPRRPTTNSKESA